VKAGRTFPSRAVTIFDTHAGQLRGGAALVFEKAKAFGARTPMHGMLLAEADGHLAGEAITFAWEKDHRRGLRGQCVSRRRKDAGGVGPSAP
jgi:hypothetical protein